MNTYWNDCFSIESLEELLTELDEDEKVTKVTTYKTGQGWLVEWEEA